MTSQRTLFDKIWDAHLVSEPTGRSSLIYIDLHLLHEVTSPQAFDGLRAADRKVRQPSRTVATVDHNIPTEPRGTPIVDPIAAKQIQALQKNGTSKLTYGLRPEAIRFSEDGVPGTLRFTEPTGPETYATVETAVGNLTLRVPGYMAAKVGDSVHVRWAPESVHLFDEGTDKRIS